MRKLTLEERIARLETLVRRYYKNESVSPDDAKLISDAARKLYALFKSTRKHADVKIFDAGNSNFINWVVSFDDGQDYVSYDLLQGKDRNYEPIGGVNLSVYGNDGEEEWSLPEKHFNTIEELLNYVRKDYH